jgi:Na+/proline symporter
VPRSGPSRLPAAHAASELASFLIPWGVILYTASGDLKATFLASYNHTAIIFLVFVICVYTVCVKDSSTDIIYDLLQRVSGYSTTECELIFKDSSGISFFKAGEYSCSPVPDNKDGSCLTMLSGGGLKFGIVNIVRNFGAVFVDQSYWQSAIAAKPGSTHKGYLLDGLVSFTIPFALATSLGLAGVALQLPITSSEAGSGLSRLADSQQPCAPCSLVASAALGAPSSSMATGLAAPPSPMRACDFPRRFLHDHRAGHGAVQAADTARLRGLQGDLYREARLREHRHR